jgi:Fur family transcriptional regulator, ferric uptake regulator
MTKIIPTEMKEKTPEIYEDVKKIFISYLEQNAHRKTPERFTILKEIYAFDGHFDIETLYIKMKNNNFRVSRATLYNTMDLLINSNLVVKHQFGQNSSLYEKSYKFKQHDHLICIDSEELFEFCDPRIQEIQKSLEATFKVKITHHSLTFYGKKYIGKDKKNKK